MKLILLIALTLRVFGQPSQKPESQKECPMHATHTQMNERGEKGMGFSQTATTHHFLLNSNGGVIQVEAKDSADSTNRNLLSLDNPVVQPLRQTGAVPIRK